MRNPHWTDDIIETINRSRPARKSVRFAIVRVRRQAPGPRRATWDRTMTPGERHDTWGSVVIAWTVTPGRARQIIANFRAFEAMDDARLGRTRAPDGTWVIMKATSLPERR